ncbi:Amylopullulanase precursor [compost metagenome]
MEDHLILKGGTFSQQLIASLVKNWRRRDDDMVKKFCKIMIILPVLLSLFVVPGKSQAAGSYLINRAVGGEVTAGMNQSPDFEGMENVFDGNAFSKWFVYQPSTWIQYHFADNQAYAINHYTIRAANDYPERDPKSWTLKGSNDGVSWTVLDTQNSQDFTYRHQSRDYTFSNSALYSYYRFDIVNHSGDSLQLAEIELFDGAEKNYVDLQPTISASGENAPNEGKEQVYDGTSTTKWLTFQSSGFLQFDYGQAITLDGYAITAANDFSQRDPKSWTLEASNDGLAWTTLDSKSDEHFDRRHQRNYYLLTNNQASFRYYKINLQNHSGDILQVGEIEFSYKEDKWHAIAPMINFQNLDPSSKGALFEQALPNVEEEVTAMVRKLCSILYENPDDLRFGPKVINIKVRDEPGVAYAGGNRVEAELGFSSQHLNNVNNSATPLRREIIGILYHELTHLYQYDDNAYGQIGYLIEGMADAVRFEVGYHDRYAETAGGTWQDGYGRTGNFIRWIDEHKHQGFLRELNASLDPFDGISWNESIFQQLTGESVLSLWSQYQASLDHSAPSAPQGLSVSNVTKSSVNLSWTASTDNAGVAGYDIYVNGVKAGTSTGANYTVSGLSAGTAYTFSVTAFDAAGNVSEPSNTASATTLAPYDSVVLTVTVPSNTPSNASIYFAGNINNWNPGDDNYRLTKNANGTYSIELNVTAGTAIEFKLTRGTWSSVEANSNGTDIANRTLTATGGTQNVNLTVQRWIDQ